MNLKSQLPCLLAGATGALLATSLPLLIHSSSADTRLLPFQGRLTDANGAAFPDGAKVVEFKIYDAPAGGTVKWAGEVHKLSVNGGLVNTLLGSKANLGSVDFSTPSYLQITIDANNDSQITAADPPLLPRQSVVPTVYASIAGQMQYAIPADGTATAKVGSAGWEAIFDNGRPDTGHIPGGKLADNSVQTTQLAPQSVTSDRIADGTITAGDLSPAVQQGVCPPGTIVAFGGTKNMIPPGWLLCDGSALSSVQAQYAPLFQRIQTNWGNGSTAGPGTSSEVISSGPGKTDFNLPDLRGQFLRGVAYSANPEVDPERTAPARFSVLAGGSQGNESGSYQKDAIVAHSHRLAVGNAFFNITTGQNNTFTSPYGYGGTEALYTNETGIQTQTIGGSETRPRNAYVNYILDSNSKPNGGGR